MSAEKLCIDKERELLDRYFGKLPAEAAERPETIGDYTLELPLAVESEYREFLDGVFPGKGKGGRGLRDVLTEDDRELIAVAHKEAVTRTLWERINRSNYKDVIHYKALLMEYTRELLTALRLEYMSR